MTKVTILGQSEPKEEKKPKPIEFVLILDNSEETSISNEFGNEPNNWQNIHVVSRANKYKKYDVFYCFNDNNYDDGILYLGHFNDGVV